MTNVYDETGFKSKSREIIKQGSYDAVLHGIVNLGLHQGQQQTFKNKETGEEETKTPEPAVVYRFIFELPNDLRTGDQLPHVIHKDVKLSDWFPKKPGQLESGFHKMLKSLGAEPTKSNILEFMREEVLSTFAGKGVTLEIIEKTSSAGNQYNRIDDVIKLHPKVTPPCPVRDFFFFNPRNPNLDIFKSTLTYWTQKEIMEALDSSNFPETLHKEWVKIEEDNASKNGNNGEDAQSTYNTAAIE